MGMDGDKEWRLAMREIDELKAALATANEAARSLDAEVGSLKRQLGEAEGWRRKAEAIVADGIRKGKCSACGHAIDNTQPVYRRFMEAKP